DQDQSERGHGTLPKQGRRPKQPPTRNSKQSTSRPWVPSTGETSQLSSFGLQLQRRRIDAVAKSSRSRSVVEDVAEMARAVGTQHLGADHAVAAIRLLVDMALRRRLRKTRPAAAGIEFCVGFEQRLA